ncbi:MAG: lipid-A-disaccharide synthase [Alphaproteobacteria bacterium]|nr:lipid-A-disaccharide synthase [Alphaproteobacteria bacterium]
MNNQIYIIAGEPSGDCIGHEVIKSLHSLHPKINLKGIGGILMEEVGVKSLFDIKEIAIGGIVEVIPKALKIKKLIDLAICDIKKINPSVLLTIDSPGFCFRIAKKIKKELPNTKLIHIVAPSVWAWRKGRAKSIAKLYDCLLTLFDFEPRYFSKFGLDVRFIGHPAIQKFNSTNNEKSNEILVMPGSRDQEVVKLLPVFIDAARKIKANKIIIPTLPHLKKLIQSLTNGGDIIIVENEQEKLMYYRRAKLAIVASGTATLQLALSKCPMVVCYKIANITYKILRKLVRVKYISLVNIILNRRVVPELIQNDCTSEKIVMECNQLNFAEQIKNFSKLQKKIQNGCEYPSDIAANVIAEYMKKSKIKQKI